jgi:NADH-quinone oxidoreductase subunit N
MGYMLVALLASGTQAILAVTFYLIAYFITTLAAFGVITVLSSKEKEFDDLADYRGLAFRHFWLSALLTTALFSLAGIPLTAGFIGKFLIVTAGVGAKLWTLVIILVLNSAVSLYYYLRVIIVLYSARPAAEYEPAGAITKAFPPSYSLFAGFALAVLAFLLVLVGVFPAPFFRLIQVLAMHLA